MSTKLPLILVFLGLGIMMTVGIYYFLAKNDTTEAEQTPLPLADSFSPRATVRASVRATFAPRYDYDLIPSPTVTRYTFSPRPSTTGTPIPTFEVDLTASPARSPSPTPIPTVACKLQLGTPTELEPSSDLTDPDDIVEAGEIDLTWKEVTGATKYHLAIADTTSDSGYSIPVSNPLMINNYTFEASAGHTYRWSVQALNDCGGVGAISAPAFIIVAD